MVWRALVAAAGISAILVVKSCGINPAYLDVALGNYHFARGQYQQAVVAYLRGMEDGVHEEWIGYNLANTYHALGESEAAMETFREASKSADRDLILDLTYNRGLLNFEMGRYREAYGDFRKTLELDPRRFDAKVNLEQALRKLTLSSQAPGQRGSAAADYRRPAEDIDRILDYVQKKEGRRWTATEQQPDSDTDRDW